MSRYFTSALLLCCLTLLSFPGLLTAQSELVRNISGVVLDAETGEPLAAANVFITNTLLGDASDEAGRFEIKNVPYGTFELVVSIIGYEVAKRRIEVDDAAAEISFRLRPKAVQGPEIEVTAKNLKKWRQNLNKFTELFLGTSRNAEECRILNPEVLDFEDEGEKPFIARADAPLEIENRALGYTISLILDSFESKGGEVTYVVYTKFSEITPRDLTEEQKWHENRQRTYDGSLRHFLKALFLNRYRQEGFLIKNMTSPSFNEKTRSLEEATRETLLSASEHPLEREFHFPEILEVTYIPELEEEAYIDFRLEHDFSLVKTTQAMRTQAKEPLNQTSWLELDKYSVTIDNFGHNADPLAVKTNGYWAWERIAELLPWEYEGYWRDRPVTSLALEMPGSGPRVRHLTISAFLGFASSGPAGDIENIMIQTGYNDVSGRAYPFSVTGLENESGASWLIEAHYSVRWSLGIALTKSEIRMGTTHGRQSVHDINVSYSVSTASLMLTAQPLKNLRLGFGPAWHSPKSGSSRTDFLNFGPKETKLGYAGDVTLIVPITVSFVAEVKAQYRYSGRAQVGPYHSRGLFSNDLPATDADFNHWFIGLGFGFGL